MRKALSIGSLMALILPMSNLNGAEVAVPAPVGIVVFPFELEDMTPAAGYTGGAPQADDELRAATAAAREQLAASGRYRSISVDGQAESEAAFREHNLRDCDGCEAAIARRLGAQQSMIGLVRRATLTDYYIAVLIRDANTGKVLDVQSANFAGGPEGWASGVKRLIQRQVLAE